MPSPPMRLTLADTGEEEELRAQSTCRRAEGFMEQTALLCHPVTKAWADRYRRLHVAADDKCFHSISNLINGALLASKENRVYKFQIPVVRGASALGGFLVARILQTSAGRAPITAPQP